MTDFYSSGRLLTAIPRCRYTRALLLLDPECLPGGGDGVGLSVAGLISAGDLVITRPNGTLQAVGVEVVRPDAFDDGAKGNAVAEIVTSVLRRADRFGVLRGRGDVDDVAGLFEGFDVEYNETSGAINLGWAEQMPGATLPLCQHLAEHLDLATPHRGGPWLFRGEEGYITSGYAPSSGWSGGCVFLVGAAGHEVYDTVDIMDSRNAGTLPEHTQDAIVRIFTEQYGEGLEDLQQYDAAYMSRFIQSIVSRASRGILSASIFPSSLGRQLKYTRVEEAARGKRFVESLTPEGT